MAKTNNKCVLVTGPESSGSRLIARIASEVLNVQRFKDYSGMGTSYRGKNKVEHISLPSGPSIFYPDIDLWINQNKDFDLYFILATRDINISKLSKMNKFARKKREVDKESKRAEEITSRIIKSGIKYFIWSYETFMFLQKDYLDLLYDFLGVESDFMPELKDGNLKYLKRPRTYLGRKIQSLKRRLLA